MSRRTLEAIKGMLCTELEELVKRGNITAGNLDEIHKMTDTIKNVYKIEMYENNAPEAYHEDWDANDRSILMQALDVLRK